MCCEHSRRSARRNPTASRGCSCGTSATRARAARSARRWNARRARSPSSTTPTWSTTRTICCGSSRCFVDERADAVFGSRFAGGDVAPRAPVPPPARQQVPDVALQPGHEPEPDGHGDVLQSRPHATSCKSIPIVSNDFRLEPELTIKLAKRQARIFEVPISYSGRTYQEGKKINWRDGVSRAGRDRALRDLRRDLQARTRTAARSWRGSAVRRSSTPGWPTSSGRSAGMRVLEIGGGVGNLTLQLVPRWEFVVSDINPLTCRR